MNRVVWRNKKLTAILVAVCLLYLYGVYGIFSAGKTAEYAQAVASQSSSKMELYKSRGTIYDCNMEQLTNQEEALLAVAVPVPESIGEIQKSTGIDPESAMRNGTPILYYADKKVKSPYIDFFSVPKRYGTTTLSPNLLGYVDGGGNGVAGVEQAFNDILCEPTGTLTLRYATDALGRAIVGEEREYENTLTEAKSGIALTLNGEIQRAAELAASKIEKGAVVVLSVPDGKLKACVSAPDYDPNALEAALKGQNAPMINRAFTAFSPGSVFKLAVAAAALESGMDGKDTYTCTGTVVVDGMPVTCYGGKAHGQVNLHTALQKSCNCYFIRLANRLSPQVLCSTALNLGLGTETVLYEGLSADSGTIPEASALALSRAVANFAIGQGDVMVTPVQVAAMINTIVSEGTYTVPSIYEGEVSSDGTLHPAAARTGRVSALEASVALRIKNYMVSAAKYGTASTGAPESGIAGAKTGTAQTGVFVDGEELLNYWYAGFVGSEKTPEYVIVVLSEGSAPSENNTPEVFREIGEFLVAHEAAKKK